MSYDKYDKDSQGGSGDEEDDESVEQAIKNEDLIVSIPKINYHLCI